MNYKTGSKVLIFDYCNTNNNISQQDAYKGFEVIDVTKSVGEIVYHLRSVTGDEIIVNTRCIRCLKNETVYNVGDVVSVRDYVIDWSEHLNVDITESDTVGCTITNLGDVTITVISARGVTYDVLPGDILH